MIRAAALVLALAAGAFAQVPGEFRVEDTPGDTGGSVLASWNRLPDENEKIIYVVLTSGTKDGEYAEAGRFPATASFQSDAPQHFGFSSSNRDRHFFEVPLEAPGKIWVKLAVESPSGTVSTEPVKAEASPNWWAPNKNNVFFALVAIAVVTLGFIARARRNPDLFIRRIPGLDAMEEAIGRATEMGKPVMFLNGLDGMSSISTIAATSILGQVAKRVAAYDTRLLVPCFDPVVLSVSQEVLREGFTSAGRPDSYREQDAFFVTNDQFSYVAAVDGIMLREKPAACFYMGYYYAESLLLAETGGSVGAIQIAGTDSVTQLPFFIASCDYTLIGEELYAASAYLSREPIQLGSLKALDVGKMIIIAIVVLGSLIALTGAERFRSLFTTF